jgi:hypothetical protein
MLAMLLAILLAVLLAMVLAVVVVMVVMVVPAASLPATPAASGTTCRATRCVVFFAPPLGFGDPLNILVFSTTQHLHWLSCSCSCSW